MNSRNNRSIDMKPNHVKNSDFRSILYSKPLREYKKPKLGIGDRFRISKYDLLFRKGNKPQFTQKKIEIVAIATKKPATYTIKDEQEYGFIYNRVGFPRIFTALSKEHSQFIYKYLAGASEFGRPMGGSNFREFLPNNVPKRYRGEVYVLR